MAAPTYYSIWLSRPSDVDVHVDAVKQAVTDANLLLRPLGVQFTVFDWRADATPGMDKKPQARINQQAEGFHALIALVGAKLGSPTKGYSSGTAEEIELAIAKAKDSVFGNNSVMVFFKDVQLDMGADFAAAAKVQELRTSLGPRGILFKEFSDDDDLREGVLRSLGVLVAQHQVRPVTDEQPAVTANEPLSKLEGEAIFQELGVLDFSDQAVKAIVRANLLSEEISAALELLGASFSAKGKEVEDAISQGDRARQRRLLAAAAVEMNECSALMLDRAPEISAEFSAALLSMRSILEIQAVDVVDIAEDERRIATEMASNLIASSSTARESIEEFRETVTKMPRLTKEINSAKKRLLEASDAVTATLANVERECGELIRYSESVGRLSGEL